MYIKGGANDHFFEGESPFKKARRFAEEVHFKILQNEANNGPPETGAKWDMALACVHFDQLLKTMQYSCSNRVFPF